MADLTITATSVVKGTDAGVNRDRNAGETITAGQCVYLKSTDGKWWKAQSDGTAAEATVIGIALHGAAADQPLAVQTSGTITIGSTPTVGTIYVVSATAGGIAPWADLTSGKYVSVIGYGKSATELKLGINVTGVTIP